MIRLFFKLYGFLIATLLVIFFAQQKTTDYLFKEFGGDYIASRYQATFYLLEQALARHPQAEWPRRFDELKGGFGVPASLIDLNDRARLADCGQGEGYQGLLSGSMCTATPGSGARIMFQRLKGAPWVAAFEFPSWGRLSEVIDAINWAFQLALLALLIWFWARPFWRDLMNLRAAATQVGDGQLDVQVAMRRGSPLYHFAECFNGMTRKIAALIDSHRQLTSAVSHELRTPIARLRFSHRLASEARDEESRRKYLAMMELDVDELDELASELLAYAKLQREAPAIERMPVPAQLWLQDVTSGAERFAEASHRQLRFATEVRAEEISCEPRYMARAVANLMRNAIRYARSTVRVSVERDGEATRIHVDDDGPGIPPGERERVFEPFSRVDESRDRASGGVGLGLAIVRQIAAWHGGRAMVGDSDLGGARVTIAW